MASHKDAVPIFAVDTALNIFQNHIVSVFSGFDFDSFFYFLDTILFCVPIFSNLNLYFVMKQVIWCIQYKAEKKRKDGVLS